MKYLMKKNQRGYIKGSFLSLFPEGGCWNDVIETMAREDRDVYNLLLEIGLERIKQHGDFTTSSDTEKMFVLHG